MTKTFKNAAVQLWFSLEDFLQSVVEAIRSLRLMSESEPFFMQLGTNNAE